MPEQSFVPCSRIHLAYLRTYKSVGRDLLVLISYKSCGAFFWNSGPRASVECLKEKFSDLVTTATVNLN